MILGKVDFSDLKLDLTTGENPVSINYGLFINALISFLIVAFAVFVLIKAINKLQEKMIKEDTSAELKTKECPYCCTEISIRAKRCPHCTSELQ